MSFKLLFVVALLSAFLPQPAAFAGDGLPTFADFQRVDRTRRVTGQLQSAESLEISRVPAELIVATARETGHDAQMLWGAAESMVDWPKKRELLGAALSVSGTNIAIALRYGCAAARHGEVEDAMEWLRYCQHKDRDNTVPWLAEVWLWQTQKQSKPPVQASPSWTMVFNDFSIEASRARIRFLEKAGYSAYAARRLGFKPDSDALSMLRDLCKPPIGEGTRRLLRESGISLQQHPQFLLTELIGQTVERAAFAGQPGSDVSEKVDARMNQIAGRREELTKLVTAMERDTIDLVTEEQMVDYYDDILALGEENAMKRLKAAVHPAPAPAAPR